MSNTKTTSNGMYLDEGKACLTMHLGLTKDIKYCVHVSLDYCNFNFMHYYMHVLTVLHSCIIIYTDI